MSEKTIVDNIRKYLHSIGCKTEKQHGTMYGKNGVPDILGCLPDGRMLALEVKRPGEKPTPLQKYELLEWAARHAITGVVESVAQVKELLSISLNANPQGPAAGRCRLQAAPTFQEDLNGLAHD